MENIQQELKHIGRRSKNARPKMSGRRRKRQEQQVKAQRRR